MSKTCNFWRKNSIFFDRMFEMWFRQLILVWLLLEFCISWNKLKTFSSHTHGFQVSFANKKQDETFFADRIVQFAFFSQIALLAELCSTFGRRSVTNVNYDNLMKLENWSWKLTKITKKSHSTLRAKRAMFTFWVDKSWLKMPKIVHFGELLKTWSLCLTE